MRWLVTALLAATLAGGTVTEPETGRTFEREVAGASGRLICLGAACRKKTGFNVKVYAIAHWIDAAGAARALAAWRDRPAADLAGDQTFFDALCAADVETRLRLVFVRGVSDRKVRGGFRESLEIAYAGDLPPVAERFLGLLTDDVGSGDVIELRRLPGGVVEVHDGDGRLGRLDPDPAFARAVWKMYFQEKLVDRHLETVKTGLVANIDAVWAMAPAEPRAGWPEMPALSRAGRFYFSGQPGEAGLRRAAAEGVGLVVNLRTAEEMAGVGYDEPRAAAALGLDYVSIPVTPSTFSVADVERFTEAIAGGEGAVLVQCRSSNRSGGLWAAYLVRERGLSWERALELGRAAGLRSGSMVEAARRVAEAP